MPLLVTVNDLQEGAAVLRRRRYGVIETTAGRLHAVRLRPWPKLISVGEVWWQEAFFHRGAAGDRCRLYYDQPRRMPSFLALKYVVTSHGASFATLLAALDVLDEIARLKDADAIVCEAWNRRISDRALARAGWERHVLHSRRRHYIKRFYGQYPAMRLTLYLGDEEPLVSQAASHAWSE
jgi:hypothetical protein